MFNELVEFFVVLRQETIYDGSFGIELDNKFRTSHYCIYEQALLDIEG